MHAILMYIIKPSQLGEIIHSFLCWEMGAIVRTPLQLFKEGIDITKNPKKRGMENRWRVAGIL